MRKSLSKLNSRRISCIGIFVKYGTKSNWHGFPTRTVLLKNIKDMDGNLLTEHLWFNGTKGFHALGELKLGDVIEFDARVKEYTKGYVNWRKDVDEREVDFKLSHPSKIRKLNKESSK